ncbi:MAG: hypothetical protein WD801_09630 [Gemmatimonadaceae bacterium]
MARRVFAGRAGRGTHHGTHFFDFSTLGCLVELCGDAFPTVSLVAPRRVAAIHPRDHLHVGVPELASHELVRRAGADGADRVEVPRVVDAVVRESEHPEPPAVHVADLPAMETTEQALTRRQGCQVRLEERPGPLRNADDAIARVRLCPAGPDLAAGRVHVVLHARERRGDLHAGAVQHREECPVRLGSALDNPAHVAQIQLYRARPVRRWCLDIAHGVRGEDADLDEIRGEAANCRQVLPLGRAGDGTRGRVRLPARSSLRRPSLLHQRRPRAEPLADLRRRQPRPRKRPALRHERPHLNEVVRRGIRLHPIGHPRFPARQMLGQVYVSQLLAQLVEAVVGPRVV